MGEALDLFGQPVIRRSAVFRSAVFRGTDCRIKLSRRWAPGPIACVIGHNPSAAGGQTEDPTSRWWNRWFQLFGFGGYDTFNLYPWISANPADVYRRVEGIDRQDWDARDALHYVNLPAVIAAAKAADQVFVCWGGIARDDDWIEHVIEEIHSGVAPYPDLWCWGKTGAGAPKHPMARGLHRIPTDQKPILWRASG